MVSDPRADASSPGPNHPGKFTPANSVQDDNPQHREEAARAEPRNRSGESLAVAGMVFAIIVIIAAIMSIVGHDSQTGWINRSTDARLRVPPVAGTAQPK